jgi:hypothetical protein
LVVKDSLGRNYLFIHKFLKARTVFGSLWAEFELHVCNLPVVQQKEEKTDEHS